MAWDGKFRGNSASDPLSETKAYDVPNRLVYDKIGSATAATYAYQPDSLRLSKTVAGVRTTHVWDGSQMVAELNASNAVTAKYLRAGGKLVASVDSSNAMKYYLYNGHGDVTALANASGELTRAYKYDAFGNEESPQAGDVNPFRYAGEYFDKETGSVYLRQSNQLSRHPSKI